MSFWVEKKRNGTTEKNKKVGKKKQRQMASEFEWTDLTISCCSQEAIVSWEESVRALTWSVRVSSTKFDCGFSAAWVAFFRISNDR